MNRHSRIHGVILGTAVGDALGLPAEGLSRQRIEALGWANNWRHRFIGRSGMLSDDSEHTLLVAEALSACNQDVDVFRTLLASKFRRWLALLPAGVGMATAHSIIKLYLGCNPKHSGVFSAGNGPAMRSALIGVTFDDDVEKIRAFVEASTQITHSDPKALVGALAIAYTAAAKDNLSLIWERFDSLSEIEHEIWPNIARDLKTALDENIETAEFAKRMNLSIGVSGYIYHTAPMALFVWLKWLNHENAFERAMNDILNCGGDSDTTGAIVGALAGASTALCKIPESWISGIHDWPNSLQRIESAAAALEHNIAITSPPIIYILLRNLFFLAIVLVHGFLRLVPSAWRRSQQ